MAYVHRVAALKACKRWGKQEKLNAALQIESADFRQDRKRWIIEDHAAVWVFVVLIISAGVKWADYHSRIDFEFGTRPVFNHFIDGGRRITIIRGQLRFELFHKFFIRFAFHTAPP